MKKINAIISIFVLIIAFLLYKNMNLYFNVKIIPTRTSMVPLYGEWTADKFVKTGKTDLSDEKIKALIGKKAIFSSSEAKFNNDNCKFPNYKVKVVDAEKYFLSNFKIKTADLGISEKQVKVITISSRNSFYDEYIQISDNYILKNYEGVCLFLKRKGGKVKEIKENKIENKGDKKYEKREVMSQNGLLIGLRRNNGSEYQYRTLWIHNTDDNKFEIKEMSNLIVPRKNGFMVVGVDNITKDGKYIDNRIWTGNLNIAANSIVKNTYNIVQSDVNYKINFVGNEYISMENTVMKTNDNNKNVLKTYLSVLPLDNIYGNSIPFSKIIGGNNDDLLSKNAEDYLQKLGRSDYKINNDELETNWGIIRMSGKWVLRGRIANENFSVNVEPPKILTSHDELFIPFRTIKSKFPDVLDAYTSLNNNFMILITRNNLKIVSINNNTIGKVETSIDINENEQSVMSQWAVGSYVDKWDKIFKNVK